MTFYELMLQHLNKKINTIQKENINEQKNQKKRKLKTGLIKY